MGEYARIIYHVLSRTVEVANERLIGFWSATLGQRQRSSKRTFLTLPRKTFPHR